MAEKFSNNGQSTLLATIAAGDTSLQVANAAVFPASGNFRLVIDSEILLVTAVSSNTFTVSRAQEGTTAAPHNAGALVTHVLTAAAMTNNPGPMTTQGDMVYANATGDPARLAIGSANQVLTVSGGLPSWQTPAADANDALTNAANTFTTGPQTINTGADANGGLKVVGNSASQSGSLLQLIGAPSGTAGLAELDFQSGSGSRVVYFQVNDDTKTFYIGTGPDGNLIQWVMGQGGAGDCDIRSVRSGGGFGFNCNGSATIDFGNTGTSSSYTINFGVRTSDGQVCSGGTFNFYGVVFQFEAIDAVTNSITECVAVRHHTTGTPAAGFGESIQWQLDSSTTANRLAAEEQALWATATDASRKGRWLVGAHDAGTSAGSPREAIRAESDGANPLLGFFAASAVGQQSIGPAATDAASTQTLANNIRQALINLGLCKT
jgi:hypothetical protein